MVAKLVAAGMLGLLPAVATASPPDSDCGLEDPRVAESAPPIADRAGHRRTVAQTRVVRPQFRSIGVGARGALEGKVVYLSPGHGFTYLPALSGWRTQRGNTHSLVEDLISVETVSYFLARNLRNMGATVVPVRELDTNSHRVIVDETDFDFGGSAGLVARSMLGGYARVAEPITGAENPFDAGNHLIIDTAPAGDDIGEVQWALDVPAAGHYSVYVGYVSDPSRAPDAHYVVRHSGGETHLRVDQRRRGGTWLFLGRFHFDAGLDPERASVALLVDSETAGSTVSADVVRIGGGMGPFDRGGGLSGRPMFEHSARYYTQWAGAPASVYGYLSTDPSDDRSGDVGCRPRFAAWDHQDGEDAVYVAWHTNAPSPARGTSSYAYSELASGTVDDFAGVPGSLELMDAIHTQLVADLRADFDPDWQDRGQRTAFFGEVNPTHNPEMPATLLEVAFHDTAEDADALREPSFRRIAARAIARGIAKYFATRDGVPLVVPPEPPTSLRMENIGSDQIRVSWAATPSADGHVVYLSPNGLGFESGVEVDDDEWIVDMSERDVVFARVAAKNAGGESLPSRVLGSRRAADGGASVLVVAAFDRLDGRMLIPDDLGAFDIDVIERGLLDRINDGSHVSRYGLAISAFGASFDTADASAIAAGDVRLADYDAVIWFTGEESEADDPLNTTERAVIGDYLAQGGQLWLSGTELAWTLDNALADELGPFFATTFGASYVADDAETYDVVGVGPWAGLGAFRFDDNGPGGYDADLPDVLAAVAPDATVVLEYGGAGGAAAIWAPSLGVLLSGFPFETVADAAQRDRMMAEALTAFEIEPEPEREEGGCGCQAKDRSGGSSGGALALALLTLALARFRVRWQTRSP